MPTYNNYYQGVCRDTEVAEHRGSVEEVGNRISPHKPTVRSGECCKLSAGSGQSPGCKHIFVHFLLRKCLW